MKARSEEARNGQRATILVLEKLDQWIICLSIIRDPGTLNLQEKSLINHLSAIKNQCPERQSILIGNVTVGFEGDGIRLFPLT